MIHKPLSAIVESSIAPTAANFAKLKHLFLFNEATAADGFTLIDSINGSNITGTGTLTANADGTISIGTSISNVAPAIALAPVAAGAKVMSILFTKQTAAANFKFGKTAIASNLGYEVGTATPRAAANAAAAAVGTTPASSTSGAWQGLCCTFNFGSATGIGSHKFDGTTFTRIADAGDVSAAGFTAGFQPEAFFTLSNSQNPALLAVFHPTTLPSDAFIKSMLEWMYEKLTVEGEKALYPLLAELS